jgi:hypothetical protein
MELEEKFEVMLNDMDIPTKELKAQFVQTANEYAVGFARWFREQCLWNDSYANKNDNELLQIYKENLKSKGLYSKHRPNIKKTIHPPSK